jgi:glucose/mannose transport system substrate-binding protein
LTANEIDCNVYPIGEFSVSQSFKVNNIAFSNDFVSFVNNNSVHINHREEFEMSRQALVLAYAALLGVVAAAHPAAAQTADVIHWWTSGSESKAVGVVAAEFEKRGGSWVDNAVVGGPAARAAAMNRIAAGNPPVATMWNVGVAVRQLAAQGLLNDLDDVARAGNWAQNLPPLILKNITYEGHVVAAPIDIHGGNWMFYSTKIFRELNLEPARSWDEFLAQAEKIKAAGYTPLAIGGQPFQENWLWMPVLIGVAGKDTYRKIYAEHDAKLAGSEAVTRAFEVLGKLRQYTDAGRPNRKWNDTLLLVQNNKAAVQIVGDWAKGEFAAAGMTPGKEFGCVLAPGNQDAYVMTVDVFAFPKSSKPEAAAAQKKLAEVMMDPAVQVQFNALKGALPARLDAEVGSLDICSQIGQKVLLGGAANQMPNAALAFSPDVDGQVLDLVTSYFNNPSMSAAEATKQFARIIANADS